MNHGIIAFCGAGGTVGKNDARSRTFKGQPVTSLWSMQVGTRSDRA